MTLGNWIGGNSNSNTLTFQLNYCCTATIWFLFPYIDKHKDTHKHKYTNSILRYWSSRGAGGGNSNTHLNSCHRATCLLPQLPWMAVGFPMLQKVGNLETMQWSIPLPVASGLGNLTTKQPTRDKGRDKDKEQEGRRVGIICDVDWNIMRSSIDEKTLNIAAGIY